jgi:hypothetical protein
MSDLGVAGLVITAVSAAIGIGVKALYRVEDAVVALRVGMNAELGHKYSQLGRTLSRPSPVEQDVKDDASNIARAHCDCHDDLMLIVRTERAAFWLLPVVMAALAASLTSILLGATALKDPTVPVQVVMSVGIPFLSLVGQFLFFGLLRSRSKEARNAASRYERTEL